MAEKSRTSTNLFHLAYPLVKDKLVVFIVAENIRVIINRVLPKSKSIWPGGQFKLVPEPFALRLWSLVAGGRPPPRSRR